MTEDMPDPKQSLWVHRAIKNTHANYDLDGVINLIYD
jgi:hypothetical protein